MRTKSKIKLLRAWFWFQVCGFVHWIGVPRSVYLWSVGKMGDSHYATYPAEELKLEFGPQQEPPF